MIIRNGITKFAAVVLATAMFTGCVEDNESASVTGIRDAKAAQLTALAGLSNAQAEAALITANAEAALINAEAAYQAALTAAEGLENQLLQIALDKASANLALEIEIAKTQAEAELARAKASLESAKADLVNALDSVTTAEKERIVRLLGQYDGLLVKINNLRVDLIDFEGQLIAAESGLIKAENVKEAAITESKVEIASLKAEIAYYNSIASSGDKQAAAESALVTAKENASKATVIYNDLVAVYETAKTADSYAYELLGCNSEEKPELIDYNLTYVNAFYDLAIYSQDESIYTGSCVSTDFVNGYYSYRTGQAEVVFTSEGTGRYTKLVVDIEALDKIIAEQTLAITGMEDSDHKGDLQSELDDIKALRTDVTGKALDEYNAAIKKYLDAAEAKREASLDVVIARMDTRIANNLVSIAASLVADINIINNAILEAETAIAKEEANIENVSSIETKENAIEWIKEQIAAAEAKLEINEAQATALKSQIDTLVATAK